MTTSNLYLSRHGQVLSNILYAVSLFGYNNGIELTSKFRTKYLFSNQDLEEYLQYYQFSRDAFEELSGIDLSSSLNQKRDHLTPKGIEQAEILGRYMSKKSTTTGEYTSGMLASLGSISDPAFPN